MSTGSQGGLPPASVPMRELIKDAAIWALVTLGLCFPMIAFRTDLNFSHQPVIDARPFLVAFFVLTVFAGRLLWRLYSHPLRPRRVLFPPLDLSHHRKAWLPRAGLAALLIFPWLALMLTGQGGAIKWIDNFGVQILIYVMLAWGLNIVVGLAGLLDLGYVAFYAVGAYTYAIIATYVIPATVPMLGPWAFWICLPLAGILAAFWGMLLGFPVLRLRGDYLAIVTLAFGEIIRLVLINWVALTNGNVGIQTPRITFFGLPFTTRTGETTFADVFHLPGLADRAPVDLPLLRDLGPRPAGRLRHPAHAAPARGARLGSAARGRDRLPVARHQHGQHQADRLRHGRAVRRPRRRVLRRPTRLRQSALI